MEEKIKKIITKVLEQTSGYTAPQVIPDGFGKIKILPSIQESEQIKTKTNGTN